MSSTDVGEVLTMHSWSQSLPSPAEYGMALEVRLPSADAVPNRAQEGEDQADNGQDGADGGDDADVEQHPHDDQDDTENDHDLSPLAPVSVRPSSAPAGAERRVASRPEPSQRSAPSLLPRRWGRSDPALTSTFAEQYGHALSFFAMVLPRSDDHGNP